MNDLANASLFFLIFAAALVLYGVAIAATGDINLLPYRAARSIGNKEEVRRVGRIVVVCGLVIGALALLVFIFSHLG